MIKITPTGASLNKGEAVIMQKIKLEVMYEPEYTNLTRLHQLCTDAINNYNKGYSTHQQAGIYALKVESNNEVNILRVHTNLRLATLKIVQ